MDFLDSHVEQVVTMRQFHQHFRALAYHLQPSFYREATLLLDESFLLLILQPVQLGQDRVTRLLGCGPLGHGRAAFSPQAAKHNGLDLSVHKERPTTIF